MVVGHERSLELRLDAAQGKVSDNEAGGPGWVEYPGIATGAGVLYYNDEGGERNELRHPDDVGDVASIASLDGVPVVMLPSHPERLRLDASGQPIAEKVALDDTTTTGNAVGVVRQPRFDGKDIHVRVRIWDRAANERIPERPAVSAGYRTDEYTGAMASGVFNGTPYQRRQRNIRYNHLLVGIPAGRVPGAMLRTDSADTVVGDFVQQVGAEWGVFAKDGRRLGTHKTREEALAQLGAVEARQSAERGDQQEPPMAKIMIGEEEFEVNDKVAAEMMRLREAMAAAAESQGDGAEGDAMNKPEPAAMPENRGDEAPAIDAEALSKIVGDSVAAAMKPLDERIAAIESARKGAEHEQIVAQAAPLLPKDYTYGDEAIRIQADAAKAHLTADADDIEAACLRGDQGAVGVYFKLAQRRLSERHTGVITRELDTLRGDAAVGSDLDKINETYSRPAHIRPTQQAAG